MSNEQVVLQMVANRLEALKSQFTLETWLKDILEEIIELARGVEESDEPDLDPNWATQDDDPEIFHEPPEFYTYDERMDGGWVMLTEQFS